MRKEALIIILILALFFSIYNPILFIHSNALNENNQFEIKIFPKKPYSYEPVLIFCKIPSSFNKAEFEIEIIFKIFREERLFKDFSKVIRIPLLPLNIMPKWYFTTIVGLPSLSYRTILAKWTIKTEVTYKLIVDNEVKNIGSYTISEGSINKSFPPIVFSFVKDILKNEKLLEETYGLSPKGWSIDGSKSIDILTIAFDDKEIEKIDLFYSVMDNFIPSIPSPLTSKESEIMNNFTQFISEIDPILRNIMNIIPDLKLEAIKLPIMVCEATIHEQGFGKFISFYAIAKDNEGNSRKSPIGLYYTDNENSPSKILIIDPHLKLNLIMNTSYEYKYILEEFSEYFPEELLNKIEQYVSLFQSLDINKISKFHYWNILSNAYDIYITEPNTELSNILNDFQPNVILLSSLSLGYKEAELFDWDIGDYNDQLQNLIEYVKKNHAGIIATHGTLSDFIYWKNPDNIIKIGSREHIGYKLEKIDIMEEKTLSSLLGMHLLTLYEYIKDEIAKQLYPINEELSKIIGSTPLQIPNVPFNGTIEVLDKENEIMHGLPEKFNIFIPFTPYYYKGYNASTEVGWQLSFPKLIANKTYLSTLKISEIILEVGFIEDLIEKWKIGISKYDFLEKIVDALKEKIYEFYNSIIKSNINIIDGTMELKILNEKFKLSLEKNIISKLSFYSPIKLIAASPDRLAGIIIYDKFFDENGYRSVYFSFEPEAGCDINSWTLLFNAIEWVKKWEFKDIMESIDNKINVLKDIKNKFIEKTSQYKAGLKILSENLLLNEEGYNIIEIKDVINGKYNVLIIHPTCKKINLDILSKNMEILEENIITEGITEYILLVKENVLTLGIKSDQQFSLNLAYIEIWSQQPITIGGNIEVRTLFDKKSYNLGDKGEVTITIINKEPIEIAITYVGIWFSWLKEGYYYSKEYTQNPIYLNVGETHDFNIKFEIDPNLTQGIYEYSLLIIYNYKAGVKEEPYLWKSVPENILIEEIKHIVKITIDVIDSNGRPIKNAIVKIVNQQSKTDINGKAIFMNVPIETSGTAYDVSIEKDEVEIAKEKIIVLPTRTEFTILGAVYDLKIQVVGAAGQGLASSTVVVKRAGVEVATLTTDPNGVAIVPQLVASDYDVEVLCKGFSGSASISASDLAAGKVVTISLPPYAEVFGMTLTFPIFLIILLLIILIIIAILIIVKRKL